MRAQGVADRAAGLGLVPRGADAARGRGRARLRAAGRAHVPDRAGQVPGPAAALGGGAARGARVGLQHAALHARAGARRLQFLLQYCESAAPQSRVQRRCGPRGHFR